MSDAPKLSQLCMRCGYQLVGPPLPTRCSECGYPVVYQSRWREGELHRAGPPIVWPVTKRFTLAAVLLFISVFAAVLCEMNLLQQLKISRVSTNQWSLVPFFIVAPIAAYLWSKPINAPGSDTWGLHKQSTFRSWVLPCAMFFWCVAFGLIMNQLRTVTTSDDRPWMTMATFMLLPALVGWFVVLFHIAHVALYLRNETPIRVCTVMAWTMPVICFIALALSSKFQMIGGFETVLWAFAVITIFITATLSIWIAWDLANCLTHSYDTQAREERLAKQNAERYSTPK